MTAQVADGTGTVGRIETPAEGRGGVGHVVLGVDPAESDQLADLATGDDLPGQRGDRVLQVVEADHGLDPGRLGHHG
jgi:hypothetical protein